MPAAPLPNDEAERLQALRALGVLDSLPDTEITDLAAVAAGACGTPIALVSLVDGHRQWFKAQYGWPGPAETTREAAFCAHTILGNDLLEVPDASVDARFLDSELVTGAPHVRFYAGAPLTLESGHRIGSLCVFDYTPRSLSAEQRATLLRLARVATRLLDNGLASRESARLHAAQGTPDTEHPIQERRPLSSFVEATEVATWEWDIRSNCVSINKHWAGLIGHTMEELQPVSLESFEALLHPDDTEGFRQRLDEHFRGQSTYYDCELRMRHRQGHWVWLQARGRVLNRDEDGNPQSMLGIHVAIGERKEQEEALRRSQDLLEVAGRIAGVGGYEVDMASGKLTWTDETKRIHGVPLDYEPTVETAIEFYAPEARAPIQQALAHVMLTGENMEMELPLIRADGQRIWVRAQGSGEVRDGQTVRVFGAFQDVTDRRELTDALAEKNELLHVTLQSIGDAVITTDPQGRVSWMNPVAERLTGCDLGDVKDLHLADTIEIVQEESREPLENPITTCLQTRKVVSLRREAVLVARDGNEYAVKDTAAPIVNDDGELLGAVMVLYDVTEQRRLTGEMSYRARHDALTGLVNRSEFETRLGEVLAEASEHGVMHSVLYLDLDQFKMVNDTCGHSAGDELLVQMTDQIKACVRSNDTVARLGGDEFAIILEHCPPAQAETVAQEICERVRRQRFVHGDHRFRLGVSIGLVALHGSWPTTAAIMQAADTACYAAKEAGRDRVHCYRESDSAIMSQQSRTRWALRIEEALEQERFTLHAQRIEPLGEDDAPQRFELLVRLQESDGRLTMPGAFIPAAERFRLMSRIDRWVLSEAVALASNPGTAPGCQLFLNFSGQSLGDRAFHEDVREHLEGIAPDVRERLVFEVTETEVIANINDARDFLDAVRALGVRVALDDFGAGMASYGYLRNLNFDYLKIDGQLVASMLDDALSLAAVRSFIEVAGVLKLPVIAEHVESDHTLQALHDMGVQLAQGFHIHRPAPAEETLSSATAPVQLRR